MENEKEINVLDELSKGASMGKDAIKFILEKVKDKGLEKELKTQYQKYEEIAEKIKAIYPEYSEDEPHETNIVNKVMTWYGIEMKTLSDDTSSKLAELVMQGTNMGIIEGRRLLNHKHTNPEINSLVQEYVDMQEDAVEALKSFL
ncbi:MAG: hypothetical protein IJO33_00850 [Bacilli bacterium]|nr:hypothetical protein [Bacilli bacterium]